LEANSTVLSSYWVGFREWGAIRPEKDVRKGWLAFFDLVKVPPRQQPLAPDWDGNKKEWKF
jgi:hypothetical protein